MQVHRDRRRADVVDTVPPSTTAEVWLPGSGTAERAGPGTHRFRG
ncbi:hypothetical protein [Streptomyces sp. MAR4 CNX-425]